MKAPGIDESGSTKYAYLDNSRSAPVTLIHDSQKKKSQRSPLSYIMAHEEAFMNVCSSEVFIPRSDE